MGQDEPLVMSSHMLNANPHKVILGVFADKEVLLVHFYKDGNDVEGRDVVVEIGDCLCNGRFLLFGVEGGRDEPAVERHGDLVFERWVWVLRVGFEY